MPCQLTLPIFGRTVYKFKKFEWTPPTWSCFFGPDGFKCVVNVAQKSCSCRRSEVIGIPCKHAVATTWNMASFGQQVDTIETWVHQVYTLPKQKDVYSFKFHPINGPSLWVESKVQTTITSPTHHKQVRRPKKKRKRSVVELEDVAKTGKLSKRNITVTYGKCHQMGHNSRTSKGKGMKDQEKKQVDKSKKQVDKTKKVAKGKKKVDMGRRSNVIS